MPASSRLPSPPPRADVRPHWTVIRRFDGSRPMKDAVRSLLAAHLS